MDFNNSFIKTALVETNLLQNEIDIARKSLAGGSNTN